MVKSAVRQKKEALLQVSTGAGKLLPLQNACVSKARPTPKNFKCRTLPHTRPRDKRLIFTLHPNVAKQCCLCHLRVVGQRWFS